MLRLLIDEHLSPRLVQWAAERKAVYALAVAHAGLAGRSDPEVWRYAFVHDLVVVTSNAGDFLNLLDVDLHPGLIILREGGLTREEQWARLEAAIDRIHGDGIDMINTVLEVSSPAAIIVRSLPP